MLFYRATALQQGKSFPSCAWRMPLLHRDFSLAFTLDFLGLYHSRYGFWQVHFRHLILHMRLALYLCNTASRILYFNPISCWNSALKISTFFSTKIQYRYFAQNRCVFFVEFVSFLFPIISSFFCDSILIRPPGSCRPSEIL